MDDFSFCWGFIAGFIVAGLMGFALQRIQLASKRAKAAHNTQPVMGQTLQTPTEVVAQSRRARMEIFGWIILIVLVFACAIIFLSQAQ